MDKKFKNKPITNILKFYSKRERNAGIKDAK